MSLVLFCLSDCVQKWIQDFKLGGAHLKDLRRTERGANILGVFRVKNHDFTPKNHIFSYVRGARAGCAPPPWIRPWCGCVVVIVWQFDLQLPVQSVSKVVNSNPAHGEVYSIQHYVIKFVSYLRQVGSFLRVLRFSPLIKLTATIQLKYC